MNRLFFFLLLACLHVSALSISGDPPRHQDAGLPIEVVMKGWEKEVRTRVENDKKFKPYLAKNSLVVLHSGLLFRDRRNAGGAEEVDSISPKRRLILTIWNSRLTPKHHIGWTATAAF